jgi:hypothetical protein
MLIVGLSCLTDNSIFAAYRHLFHKSGGHGKEETEKLDKYEKVL